MTEFLDRMKHPLASGSHKVGDGQECVMERVAILWALHSGKDVAAASSDLPECTNTVIARAAQTVNDYLTDTQRQRLNVLIPRLLRARRTESDMRVNVRLAAWAARRVLDLTRPQDREVCERAIEAVEAWLADPSDANAYAVATAHAATNAAAYATYAAHAAAAHAATYAAHAATIAAEVAAAYASSAAYAAASASSATYAAAYAAAYERFFTLLLDEIEREIAA